MIRRALAAWLLEGVSSLAWAAPVREVEVRGNLRVETDLILQQVVTRSGEEYDPARVRGDIAAIYALGYFEDIAVESSERGRLTFVVLERPALREWRIEGADEVDSEDVRKAVLLQRREILDQSRVEEGAKAIRELYRSVHILALGAGSQFDLQHPCAAPQTKDQVGLMSVAGAEEICLVIDSTIV